MHPHPEIPPFSLLLPSAGWDADPGEKGASPTPGKDGHAHLSELWGPIK